MAISYPPIFVNEYLKEKVRDYFATEFVLDGQNSPDVTIPFFPTSPTAIDTLTETFSSSQYGLFAVYDRMFKYRRRPFPHIKSEQLLYYFYKMVGDPVLLIETSQKVYDLLDREDESAQEINDWIYSKLTTLQNGTKVFRVDDGNGTTKDFKPIFFHRFKVYQLEETRDIIDFGTARTYAGNKIIIDYDYHVKDYS